MPTKKKTTKRASKRPTVSSVSKEVEALEARIARLEKKVHDTMLLEENFFKRSLAVFGHQFVGHILIVVMMAGFLVALGILGFLLGTVLTSVGL